MTNPFLVVVTVILSIAIIAGCIYLLVYFQHPEDKNTAWFPKIVVVLGLSLACFSVLMLPLDVGNSNTDGGFPMDVLWQVIYIIMAVFAVVIIPFAMFYYEGDEYDETGKAPSQLAYAIKGTLISVIVFAVLTVVMWLFLGIAEIPVARLDAPFQVSQNRTVAMDLVPTNDYFNRTVANVTEAYPDGYVEEPYLCVNLTRVENQTTGENQTLPDGSNITVNVTQEVTVLLNTTCYFYNTSLSAWDTNLPLAVNRKNTHAKFRVSFALYIITVVVFFGWMLFIIFGGIGLSAFPMDCINSWRRRPVRIPLDKYLIRKKEIGDEATRLIDTGKGIQEKRKKGRERKRDRRNYNKFRQAVFLLEEEYERLQLCYKRQGGKVILYFLTLVMGVIGVGITIVWLLHIAIYLFTQPYPVSPFLNTVVIELDDAFGLLGTAAYGVFSFYLLICCIKGNFKFGMRLFFLFPIHPMRVNGTLMNAFLFNTCLIMICAFSVTQFCTQAFADYTSLTAINSMFALSVNQMMGIKYIFIGYNYAIFIVAVLTGIYFLLRPRDKPAVNYSA